MTMTVEQPSIYGDPYVITIAGISATYPVVTLWRIGVDGTELVPGTPLVLATGGNGVVTDALYPLSGPFGYELQDSTGTVVLHTAGPFSPPQPTGDDAGKPIVIDVAEPSRRSSLEVVDVGNRTRRARVSVFATIGEAGFTTVGDIRLMSEGTFGVLFRSHASRDSMLWALSSGGPCVLRVPLACQVKLDEMWFTPGDVVEQRVGTHGAGTLSIDFTEVASPSATTAPLPPPVHVVTYAEQTANAATAAQLYSGLKAAFTGKTYRDMGLSSTGIAP